MPAEVRVRSHAPKPRAPHGAAGRAGPPRTRCGSATSAGSLEASPFHGEGDRTAWAKRRVERIRTSQERVRRLMREHGLQAPYRAGHAHGPKAHDGTITTAAPNVMWGTDMTSTVTVGEGAGLRLRGRRSLYDRVHRSPCGHAWHPV